MATGRGVREYGLCTLSVSPALAALNRWTLYEFVELVVCLPLAQEGAEFAFAVRVLRGPHGAGGLAALQLLDFAIGGGELLVLVQSYGRASPS